MKDAPQIDGMEYLDFVDPPTRGLFNEDGVSQQVFYRVPVNFLLSNWECIYGRGCPGIFGDHMSTVVDDTGCCYDGAYFNDRADHTFVAERVAELTDQDMDADRLAYIQKHGWANITTDKPETDDKYDEFVGKTKVWKGGCVFQNTHTGSVGSTGKIGCAFHHLGERTGRTNHTEIMPRVCWQLPFKTDNEELEPDDEWDDDRMHIISPWNVSQWREQDGKGEHKDWCAYWCIDTPDAYIGKSRVYRTMEQELRVMMGDTAYDEMVRLLEKRIAESIKLPRMGGMDVNDGRPLLPLIVGDRESRRGPGGYQDRLSGLLDAHESQRSEHSAS